MIKTKKKFFVYSAMTGKITRQVKLVCVVPQLCKYIPIQAC